MPIRHMLTPPRFIFDELTTFGFLFFRIITKQEIPDDRKNETHESDKTIDQVAPALLLHQDHSAEPFH